jgi:hypothetical protein
MLKILERIPRHTSASDADSFVTHEGSNQIALWPAEPNLTESPDLRMQNLTKSKLFVLVRTEVSSVAFA